MSKYPELGQEPFNVSDDEMARIWQERIPPEWQQNPPQSEKEVGQYFDRIAAPSFKLYSEVWLRHPTGQRIRIDRVAVDKSSAWQGLIGIELKDGTPMTETFTDFSKSIAQSVDYSLCRIESDLIPDGGWFSQRLRFVFRFPCLYSIYESDNRNPGAVTTVRDYWAQGGMKIAGKYGVGGVSYIPKRDDWAFILGGHPAYWLKTGPTALAIKHAQGEKLGSGR